MLVLVGWKIYRRSSSWRWICWCWGSIPQHCSRRWGFRKVRYGPGWCVVEPRVGNYMIAFSRDWLFRIYGASHYYYALTAHFGEWIDRDTQSGWVMSEFLYAQVIKQQRCFRLVNVEYRLLWGSAEEYRSRLKANGLSENINTSFVERANLTIRQLVSKLTRPTWGAAQLKSELEDHLYWWLAATSITSLVSTRDCASDY